MEFKEIFLTNMWDKSFEINSKIFIKYKDEDLKEAIILNKKSFFGENIDEIELSINNTKENYSIQNRFIKYYKSI
mgnify:CR=1 FL=1|jgi:hypothetical protein